MTQTMIKILMTTVLVVFLGLSIQHAHAQDGSIGDSIAAGTGRALGVKTQARVGASSCWLLHHVTEWSFRYVVVSAGINDAPGPCVSAIFQRIVAKRVVVILPAPINTAYANVSRLALSHGFATIRYRCAGGCSKSNFHPASYTVLAAGVRHLWSTP